MNATAVARIGLIQAMCSFHSIPNSCQSAVEVSASNFDFGLDGIASRLDETRDREFPVSGMPNRGGAEGGSCGVRNRAAG